MVHFVGAGPGAPDLITLRGAELLKKADCIIYAGSLVNPALLEMAKEGCEIHNSATMTLEEVLEVMVNTRSSVKMTVRLHTGDASLFGAIREQMDALDEKGIAYDDTPGVSSFCGAAGSIERRVHPAQREPELDYHSYGRAHPGTGKGAAGFHGTASGFYGAVFVLRFAE